MSGYEVTVREIVTRRFTVKASSSEAAETLIMNTNVGEPDKEYAELHDIQVEELA